MPRRFPTRYKLALGLAGAFAVFAACEHAHYWSDARPWPRQYRNQTSNPQVAQAELAARLAPPAPPGQTKEDAQKKSAGCVSCHGNTDNPSMHLSDAVVISCVDCHGGDGAVMSTLDAPGRPGTPGTPITDGAYLAAMRRAHVQPRNTVAWYGHPEVEYGDHHRAEQDPTKLHGSRNPEATNALLNQESPEFVRFVNPGDLRVADFSCGACHAAEVANVRQSMMTTGAQLWEAALYNNGGYPLKTAAFGESYNAFGTAQELRGVVSGSWDEKTSSLTTTVRPASAYELAKLGVVAFLEPLPVWAIAQPGNILRVFERGTKLPVPGGAIPNEEPGAIGQPNALAEGGHPDKSLSPRGLGTKLRTDPVFLGLQKTRLLDPILSFLGTNDHPGDYRSSGCTACHTPYANDRAAADSTAEFAANGNRGESRAIDPTIPHNQPGHPVHHVLTGAIPTSQCIVCHIHPGTSYANTYTGYMWWDLESDGEFMYPNKTAHPTARQRWESLRKNPDDAAARGLWGDLYPEAVSHAGETSGKDFLERTGSDEFNARLKSNQFADFHGHGWMFRAVHKKDRHGNLLDASGAVIDPNDPEKWNKAVHLADLHLARGMQCVDCHFTQDAHGDGKLYAEVRNAVEITCVDCHGTYNQKATLRTSGPAAPRDADGKLVGNDLTSRLYKISGQPRFKWVGGVLRQYKSMDPASYWEVVQTVDTINPASAWSIANPESAKKSRYAKTVAHDPPTGATTWGDMPAKNDDLSKLAHANKLECYTCHSSWMTSCAGCHLPMQANERAPMLHNESLYTRNFTRYNFQVLRDDTYQLGRDSTVKGGHIVPVRSSSAVIVSSQNANREWIYHQQQTISSEGYSGQTFNPHFPHATSGPGTTKTCTDCHISDKDDNNAWMAQLLLQGTNMVNFLGRYVYVAEGGAGLEGVAVTEHDEPQTVYGSHFHSLAWPDEYKAFLDAGRELKEAYHHDAGIVFESAKVLDVQLRGEYLYAARGPAGFYAYDVQAIDNKGFSERIVTSPVSPLGQQLGFKTKNCVAVASPTTLGVDPVRTRISSDPSKPRAVGLDEPQPWHVNQEQKIHPMYAYLYLGDSEEGLILTGAATLLDGDPTNNFLERAKLDDGSTAFNPGGVLTGLTHLTVAGHYVYATVPGGLAIIDIDKPTSPRLVKVVGSDVLTNPQCVQVQFRYAFVADAEGLKVFDMTIPEETHFVPGSALALPGEKHRLYLARTYAYIACGTAGLAIADITNAEKPALVTQFAGDENGKLTDVRDVKVGMTNASMYGYIADGSGGLKVLSLMGPDSTPNFRGFIPPVSPKIIAWHRTEGDALAISKGLDRDRAVDESGNQVAVFGRLGARPLTLDEQRALYMWTAPNGEKSVWKVSDEPVGEPAAFTLKTDEEKKEAAPSGGRRRGGGSEAPEEKKDESTTGRRRR